MERVIDMALTEEEINEIVEKVLKEIDDEMKLIDKELGEGDVITKLNDFIEGY